MNERNNVTTLPENLDPIPPGGSVDEDGLSVKNAY